jgi:hypothetical protein
MQGEGMKHEGSGSCGERRARESSKKKSSIRKEDLAYQPLLLDIGQSEATMPDDLLHLVFSCRWVRRGHGNEENIGGLDRRGGQEFSRGGCRGEMTSQSGG